MAQKIHVIEDFKVGDEVSPIAYKELVYVVIGIDTENGIIICGIPNMPDVKGRYKPEELEKKTIFPTSPTLDNPAAQDL